ncbi:hypothetical protein BKA64DRAFT_742937 [Cadophora sp. MPI-SDFR-AT-0126]|nr:hypothetical protein BKA64DRAFT_742937 [Leotiomycetes sp. MPI-SDFR-AT-0126]
MNGKEAAPLQAAASLFKAATYHLHTLYLLTKSNLKCVLLPHTIFALSIHLSSPLLTMVPNQPLSTTFSRISHILTWVYLNQLLCDISNQRLPSSIAQDTISKPWRPIPSNRLMPSNLRHLLIVAIPFVLYCTRFVGGTRESAAIIILLYIYNDLEAGDESPHLRDLLNALALTSFSLGATRVALGDAGEINEKGHQWLILTGAMIFFTISVQDLRDVEGDAATGRKSLPLVHGDDAARWMLASAIVLFSLACPMFIGNSLLVTMGLGCLGVCLAYRILWYKGVEADERSFTLWAVWCVGIYCLPIFRTLGVVDGI